jgi:hypothetical protein
MKYRIENANSITLKAEFVGCVLSGPATKRIRLKRAFKGTTKERNDGWYVSFCSTTLHGSMHASMDTIVEKATMTTKKVAQLRFFRTSIPSTRKQKRAPATRMRSPLTGRHSKSTGGCYRQYHVAFTNSSFAKKCERHGEKCEGRWVLKTMGTSL